MQSDGTSGHRAGSISLRAGGLAILCMPVSISLAQLFYALAFLSLLVERWQSRSGEQVAYPRSFGWLYGLILALYGTWVFSALAHSIDERSVSPLLALGRSDLKDVLLSGMALWAYHHAEHSVERRRLLYRFVAGGFLVLLVSGIVAVLSPYRLSRLLYHMQHGWIYSAEARLQHPMFHVPLGFTKLALHMPVGFLGTHLAYGAQLGLYFIPLGLLVLDRLVMGRDGKGQGSPPSTGNAAAVWAILSVLTALAAFVLVLNNARSALFGIISALLAGVIILTGRRWKKRAWLLLLPVLAASVVVIGLLLTGRSQAAREFVMQSVGLEQKHSDYQRVMLWSAVGSVIRDRPWIGTGPGQFSDRVLDRMIELSGDRSWLWYLYMQTERGHAHNDFLHQTASAGIPAAILFLLLWYWMLRMALARPAIPAQPAIQARQAVPDGEATDRGGKRSSRFPGFLAGIPLDDMFRDVIPFAPLLLFVGGIFQCYFLDDQVLLPFWLMVGLAFQAREGQLIRG